MNNAVLVILIVVGAIIFLLLFGQYIMVAAELVVFAATWVGSAIGLYYGVVLLVQAVQSNDGWLAALGCIITLVCGIIFVIGLILVLNWLRRR